MNEKNKAAFALLAVSLCGFLAISVQPVSALSDPPELAITDHIDLIEVNHYFDDSGKLVFDQLIFYNWDTVAGRHNVVAWRLLKHKQQLPQRNPQTGLYYSSWQDGATLRLVQADRILETWTQYDPETRERQFLPKERRADLRRIDLKRR